MPENQNPEQKARDNIDALLKQAGWSVQHNKKIDLNEGLGQAIREYQTDVGPADYVLFVDKKAVGVIEAKREEQGHKITEVESQTEGYASAKLKWVNNKEPLPFLYESTGIITRFTDARDPRPRSREVFSFHRPETLKEWITPPRQNSCRPDIILNLGAIRMNDGTIWRSIQEQSGGEVAAAGERQCGRGGERDWSIDADVGTMA